MKIKKRYLSVDLGEKRTGVAVSDLTRTIAGGHSLITQTGLTDCAKKVAAIAAEYDAQKIVVGYPLNMNGTKGESALRAEKFVSILQPLTLAEVVLFDERLSTALAHVYMNATGIGGRERKSKVDMLSAQIILQSYIDREENEKI